jgi:3-hydroxyisobutyrate dehydrogenase
MRIGFIGLGVMGAPIAARLARAGHTVKVNDLHRADMPGAAWADSAAAAVADAEVAFTSLPGPAEVEAVAAQIGPGLARGVQFLDAPVSGGREGAHSGKLALWVGGDEATYRKHEGVLREIGDQPIYVGPIGAGSVAKLVHNAASFTVQTALAEIFTLGVKAGVEPLALFKAIRQGATGRKRTFDRLAEQFLPGKYDPPGFALRLAHKDLGLALELAREVGVPMQVAQVAMKDFEEALRRGWGERDSRTPMLLQEERAGVAPRVPADKLREVLD